MNKSLSTIINGDISQNCQPAEAGLTVLLWDSETSPYRGGLRGDGGNKSEKFKVKSKKMESGIIMELCKKTHLTVRWIFF